MSTHFHLAFDHKADGLILTYSEFNRLIQMLDRRDAQPSRWLLEPLAYGVQSLGMPQFVQRRLRDQDFAEERSQDFRPINDDEVIQRSGSATTTPGAFMLQ